MKTKKDKLNKKGIYQNNKKIKLKKNENKQKIKRNKWKKKKNNQKNKEKRQKNEIRNQSVAIFWKVVKNNQFQLCEIMGLILGGMSFTPGTKIVC